MKHTLTILTALLVAPLTALPAAEGVGLPSGSFILTFAADGRPASCQRRAGGEELLQARNAGQGFYLKSPDAAPVRLTKLIHVHPSAGRGGKVQPPSPVTRRARRHWPTPRGRRHTERPLSAIHRQRQSHSLRRELASLRGVFCRRRQLRRVSRPSQRHRVHRASRLETLAGSSVSPHRKADSFRRRRRALTPAH